MRRLTAGRLQNLPKIIQLIGGEGKLNNRLNKFMTWQLFNHRFKVQGWAWFWLFVKQGSWGNRFFRIMGCVNTLYFYRTFHCIIYPSTIWGVYRCSSIVLYSWRGWTSAWSCKPRTRINLLTPRVGHFPLNHTVTLCKPIHSFAISDIQWAKFKIKQATKEHTLMLLHF